MITSSPSDPRSSPTGNGRLVLEVCGVSRSYAGRLVLQDASFRLHAGQRLALTGPSGSGKTTLLNCLGGVDRPDSGSIVLHGEALEKLSSDQLARVRRQRVGTVFQFFHLLPMLTAFENVEFPLQLIGVPPDQRRQRVESLLERVNLTARARAFPAQLSGGEMQRVAIARALIHQPDLILADEPTGNLDSANGENILALLHDLTEETHTALVLVTHSLEATRICHRTIRLRDGAVVSETVHS
jgi:putative ABC transport system ATP-binding protein